MRNILITGGSRGIGAAMVRRFSRAGDQVFFTFLHDTEAAAALAEETGAAALRSDVSRGAETEKTVREVLDRAGSVDVLICCAGVDQHAMISDTTDEEYHRVMDTNLYGTFAAMRAVLPGMFWRRNGCVITVSSIWGQEGASCEAVYSASKAGIIALTQAAAREAGGSGVRVNCVAPGLIDTRMNANLSGEDLDALREEIPLGRIGTPEEVAETAFFLAGEGAAYITGQVIPVNGGWRV